MRLTGITRRRAMVFVPAVLCLIAGGVFGPRQWNSFRLYRGSEALARHDWPGAREWLEPAMSPSSSEAERLFLLGRLERRLGRLEMMGQYLEGSARLGGDHQRLQCEVWLAHAQSGELKELESHLPDLFVAGRDLPEICDAFVAGCILNYRLDDALRVIEFWQADFPQDAQPHFLKGRILEHRSGADAAAAEYREALRVDPTHSAAAFNLGRVLIARQDPEAAITQYRVCRDHHYDPQPGLVGMAHALRLLRRYDEARACLEQARRSPPDRLVVAYRLVGEPLESARAQLPAEFGRLELEVERFGAAEPWLRTAVEANPGDWKVRYSLGLALRGLRRNAEAESEFARVEEVKQALADCERMIESLRRSPDDVEARYQIGAVFLKYISENQGLVWLRSALSYNPEYAPAHALLADYYSSHAGENTHFAGLANHHRQLAGDGPAGSPPP